ncbi:MAG: ABC transporter ATP-binding protein [Anaerolineae bacterium]|nr:ABC transporter ATP-binding protein [Thermoflexales bacterium]MDW8408393.1 ABC transporter ATP-binding protein [Anaerolineae bacterium]
MSTIEQERESNTVIELHAVSKTYHSAGKAIVALRSVSLRVQRGRLLALLGPSGCGKTTLLRLIAGLETPDQGEIWLERRPVAGPSAWVAPEQRRIGMVFQDYALFPHLTVRENIRFALLSGSPAEKERRVNEMLTLVGLVGKAERYPHQLSGGEQQRVALARALAPAPAVVLLDEPFSNLDAALRKDMREEVRRILTAAQATTVFVTHDQEEALSIADCVAVMNQGAILQVGAPQDIYHRPARREIAEFVGEANFLPAVAEGEFATCALGSLRLAWPANGAVELMVRPESIALTPNQTAGHARVERVAFFGHDQLVWLCLPGGPALMARTLPDVHVAPGMVVSIQVREPVLAYPA